MQATGQPLEVLHQFLLSNGIDAGSLMSFRKTYSRVKRERGKKQPIPPEKIPELEKTAPLVTNASAGFASTESLEQAKEMKEAHATQKEEASREGKAEIESITKQGYGLLQLILADGTPIEIDPEAGTLTFKIKKTRSPE